MPPRPLADFLALAALVTLAFAPVLVGGTSFFHLDLFFTLVPYWQFAADSVAQGHWPAWTPLIRGGYPLLANGEASLLYPPMLPLALALPAHRALDVFAIVHVLACAIGMACYLRELGLGRAATLFGAAAFALSGRIVASAIWPHSIAVSAALPFILLGVERGRRDTRAGTWIVAIAVGLALLAGRPQRLVPGLLFATAYAFLGLRERGARTAIVAGGLLGAALGAIQAVPTLALLAESGLSEGVSREIFELLSLRGKPIADALLPVGLVGGASWPEGRVYPGLAAYCGLGLALATQWRAPSRRLGFLLGALPVLLYIAWAGPGVYETMDALPVLRGLRVPARFLFPAAWAAAAAAAIALAPVLERRPWLAGLACAELALVAALTAPTAPEIVYTQRPSALEHSRLAVIDSTGAPQRVYAMMLNFGADDLRSGSQRELKLRFAAMPPTRNLPMAWGVPAMNGAGLPIFAWQRGGLESVGIGRLRQFGVHLAFVRRGQWLDGLEPAGDHGFTRVGRVPDPLPRALCVERHVQVPDFRAALALASAPEFDPATTAVVESDTPFAPAGSCLARFEEMTPTHLVIEVESNAASSLLVFDLWAPGWHAEVDGVPTPIHRANGLFRLVRVPAGVSRVEMRYSPPGFAAGATVSAVALGAWVALGYRSRPRSPTGGAGGDSHEVGRS